jgi:hypothetical protein
MSTELEPSSSAGSSAEGQTPEPVPGLTTPRRKFLRHGIAGTSAVALVAGKPVRTLAKSYCKFSGWNSVKAGKKQVKKGKKSWKSWKNWKNNKSTVSVSHAPKTCSVTIKSPKTYFKFSKIKGKGGWTNSYAAINWPQPPYHWFNGREITTNTTFNTLFGYDYAGWGGSLLLDVLSLQTNSVESYMIAAAFASCTPGFPLSQSYIHTLWVDYGNSNDAGALLEFLQQLV